MAHNHWNRLLPSLEYTLRSHHGCRRESPECALPGVHSLEFAGLITILPGVIATGRNLQATAHQTYRVLVAAALDHRVPLDDSLAKYAAASLKNHVPGHPGQLTLEAGQLLISRTTGSGKGLFCAWLCFSNPACEQVRATPISRATCRQLAPERRTNSMASRLNSGLYFLRFMNTLQLGMSLLESVRANGVEPLFGPTRTFSPGWNSSLASRSLRKFLW